MTLSVAIQSACDQAITDTLAALAPLQEQHYTAARRYAQLLPTHSTPPTDGAETAPDKADTIQEGVASSWAAVRQQLAYPPDAPLVKQTVYVDGGVTTTWVDGEPVTTINPPKATTELVVDPETPMIWETAPVPLPATLPCSLRVDTYCGPQGDGYVLVAMVVEKGVTYCRCVGVGPEKRDRDWSEVA